MLTLVLKKHVMEEVRRMQLAMCATESENDKCPICWSPFKNKSTLDCCRHEYCYSCIYKWAQIKAACPLCLMPISMICSSSNPISDEILFLVTEVFVNMVISISEEANSRSNNRRATTANRSYDVNNIYNRMNVVMRQRRRRKPPSPFSRFLTFLRAVWERVLHYFSRQLQH